MKLTPKQTRQLSNLFALADEAYDNATIHIQFVSLWESMREETGLAMLLLLVKEFVRRADQKNLDSSC